MRIIVAVCENCEERHRWRMGTVVVTLAYMDRHDPGEANPLTRSPRGHELPGWRGPRRGTEIVRCERQ